MEDRRRMEDRKRKMEDGSGRRENKMTREIRTESRRRGLAVCTGQHCTGARCLQDSDSRLGPSNHVKHENHHQFQLRPRRRLKRKGCLQLTHLPDWSTTAKSLSVPYRVIGTARMYVLYS